MMTSNKTYEEAFVWIWLPNETEPVVAGKLEIEGENLLFNYGKSYLNRINDTPNAISLYEDELPLQSGIFPLLDGLTMPGIRRQLTWPVRDN